MTELDLLVAEKHLDRVKKLLAMAAHNPNEHETARAAEHIVRYLEAHPIPIRWIIRKGARVQVLPIAALASVTRAKELLSVQLAPKDVAFGEDTRVKDQTSNALARGHLYFQRHGYCVLAPITHIEAFF